MAVTKNFKMFFIPSASAYTPSGTACLVGWVWHS